MEEEKWWINAETYDSYGTIYIMYHTVQERKCGSLSDQYLSCGTCKGHPPINLLLSYILTCKLTNDKYFFEHSDPKLIEKIIGDNTCGSNY